MPTQEKQNNVSLTLGMAGISNPNFSSELTNIAWAASTFKTIEEIRARPSMLTGLTCAVINPMLASLPCEFRLTDTFVSADCILALSVIFAGLRGTFVYVLVAIWSGPALVAGALVVKEAVEAEPMATRFRGTQVNFRLAPLPGKTSRTRTTKVINQVRTFGIEETRELGTVVNIIVAKRSIPAWLTLASEATLLEWDAHGVVLARISRNCARVDRHITVRARVAVLAEASVVPNSCFRFAHGLFWASLISAIALLILTVDSGVSAWADASVALRLIQASGPVVTWLTLAFVNIRLAKGPRESCRTEAHCSMTLRDAETAILTEIIRALDWATLLLGRGSWFPGGCLAGTFNTFRHTFLCLVETSRAGGTW